MDNINGYNNAVSYDEPLSINIVNLYKKYNIHAGQYEHGTEERDEDDRNHIDGYIEYVNNKGERICLLNDMKNVAESAKTLTLTVADYNYLVSSGKNRSNNIEYRSISFRRKIQDNLYYMYVFSAPELINKLTFHPSIFKDEYGNIKKNVYTYIDDILNICHPLFIFPYTINS